MTRLSSFSNAALLAETKRLVAREREATASLVEALREVDQRRLFLSEGFSCMFDYCTRGLRLSEPAAYKRIEVARVSRACPQVLSALMQGELSLSTAVLIAPHLTPDNPGEVAELIAAASFKSKREVERVLAERFPKPDVPDVVRKQPVRGVHATEAAVTPALLDVAVALAAAGTRDASTDPAPQHGLAVQDGAAAAQIGAASGQVGTAPGLRAAAQQLAASPHSSAASGQVVASPTLPSSSSLAARVSPPAPASVAPLSAARYKVQFTADQDTHDKLRYAQALLRHQIPSGDIAAIVKKALTLLIADAEKKKTGLGARPRAGKEKRAGAATSRRVPIDVRRAVWMRDAARCAFTGPDGRCIERGRLEYHHVVPYAAGGLATVDNIQLRCRAHNAHEAVVFFGEEVAAQRV